MKLTTQAKLEQIENKLLRSPEYLTALREEFNRCVRICKRYSYPKYPLGTPEKNMIKALRMMTFSNTPADWARLHATEAASKTLAD